MDSRATIRQIAALGLLVLFTISIAPKTYFHDLVASHRDLSSCDQQHNTSVLHTNGYHCQVDDLVVTAPFVQQQDPSFSQIERAFPPENHHLPILYFYTACRHKESRGPPAA